MDDTNNLFRSSLLAALAYPKQAIPTNSKIAGLLTGMPHIETRPQPNRLLAATSIFGNLGLPPSTNRLVAALTESSRGKNPFAQAMDDYRFRYSWNQRFEHWAKSESTTESQSIERARDMVKEVLSENAYLRGQGVRIEPQGSFTNRTNTRNDSDIDLRVQHPHVKIEYGDGVNSMSAFQSFAYSPISERLEDTAIQMRAEIAADLIDRFGKSNVKAGTKAIKVLGVNGSRAEVDVVPAFHLHFIYASGGLAPFSKLEGIAIWDMNNIWTHNFPVQHSENGKAKRIATNFQFKKIVRIVKRLRADMEERGIYITKTQSFLCECLVFIVEDKYFTVPGDDLFGRVKRVLTRALERVTSCDNSTMPCEVNNIKWLFGRGQPWTIESAASFLRAAILHLGNA